MAWAQLELEKAHIAYACVGIFSTIFSLVSLFVKERLYIGEATVATIAGLILGPHCLGWFDPVSWGNTDHLTLEICRIVLCIQIVAVAVELPRKYMKNHWVSVAIFLLPVMTVGWLVVGLFIWVLIPHFNFSSALLVSACVTATDPVLAAAVVGKGKFAERVPGHLRNLLSAESGCNDGMAFPFIFLSLNMVLYPGNANEIVKNWFLYTILWECIFGCILGAFIGYVLRKAVALAEKRNLIDRESFLAIFIFLSFNSAGIGSMLGVDDLLVSFAAGTAFGWNGDFAKKTEESHVSTVIDLLLNLAFFVYFGAIIPWPQFNDGSLGLDVWRLIVLAIVIIFLRRVPAVVALKPFTPDVKTWREAFFCGHFGPIGVGAIFATILARKDLEAHYTEEETPLAIVPTHDFPHTQLIAAIWPIVCFIVITSIVVHGSSVAVLTLGRRLNRMAITMSFTRTNTQDQGPTWMSRLQKLERTTTSFSLHRVDTQGNGDDQTMVDGNSEKLPRTNTVETSGIKVRPAGGAKRKKNKRRRNPSRIRKSLAKVTSNDASAFRDEQVFTERQRQRPQTEFLQLGGGPARASKTENDDENETEESPTQSFDSGNEKHETTGFSPEMETAPVSRRRQDSVPTVAFQEGDKIIIEDQRGEVIETVDVKGAKKNQSPRLKASTSNGEVESEVSLDSDAGFSIHSAGSLNRAMSQYSFDGDSGSGSNDEEDREYGSIHRKLSRTLSNGAKKAFYKKDDPKHRRVFAYQIDDLIVIENADGEIIRRYKVNRHNSGNQRARSSTLMGKALSLVGLKKEEGAATTPEINVTDTSNSNNLLIPESDTKNPNSPLKDPKFESHIESKLTNILKQGKEGKILKRQKTPLAPRMSDEDEDEEEDEDASNVSAITDDDEDDEDDDDDSVLDETPIERSRRLAALGHLPSSRRDANDEED